MTWNNLKNSIRSLLLIFALIVAVPAYSAPLCENVFSYSFSITNPPEGLTNKIKSKEDFEKLKPQIKQLAAELLKANRDIPPPTYQQIVDKMRDVFSWLDQKNDFEVNLLNLQPRTNYAHVELKMNDVTIEIRTNGEFAFLSSTWMYRNMKTANNYKAVGLVNGSLQVFKQTDLIVSTLPETVVLSRNMEEVERLMWLENGKFNSYFGDKVHFGPNHFLFKKTEPYRITLTKKDLLAFHKLGLLEINVYDPVNKDNNVMQLTKLGLEFEYVFVGKKAIELLRPRIKDHLRQQVLRYE